MKGILFKEEHSEDLLLNAMTSWNIDEQSLGRIYSMSNGLCKTQELWEDTVCLLGNSGNSLKQP
jgi:hypothetical protein